MSKEFTMDEIKTPAFFELLKTKDIETLHSGETTLRTSSSGDGSGLHG